RRAPTATAKVGTNASASMSRTRPKGRPPISSRSHAPAMSVPVSTKRRLVLANRCSELAPPEDGDEVVAAAENGDRDACSLEAENLSGDTRIALGRSAARRDARRIDVDERGCVPLEHTLGQSLRELGRETRRHDGELECAARRARLVREKRGDRGGPVRRASAERLERAQRVAVEGVNALIGARRAVDDQRCAATTGGMRLE